MAGDLCADKAGEVTAEIDDLPGVGLEHLQLAGGPGLVGREAGEVGDGLQFERGNGLQVLLRVAAELGADAGERTVLPGPVSYEPGPDLALRHYPRRLPDSVIRIIHTAGQ